MSDREERVLQVFSVPKSTPTIILRSAESDDMAKEVVEVASPVNCGGMQARQREGLPWYE